MKIFDLLKLKRIKKLKMENYLSRKLKISEEDIKNASKRLAEIKKSKWKNFWYEFEKKLFLWTYPIRCFLCLGLPSFKHYLRYKSMTMTKDDINSLYKKAWEKREIDKI